MVALFGGNPSYSSGKMRGGSGEIYRLVSSVASEAMGIGKSSEVLTVLGGKASCRRKFVLNLHLVDEYGNLVSRDLAIVASVAYAHDHSPVVRDEKPFLAEPPLFTTFNGVEFPAQDRPTRMVSGRASFKLAISLLSSKCDNRLFCICFTPQTATGDASPICSPCYSKPIRSISRKRTQSAQVPPAPPLLLLAGLEAAPSSSTRYNNNNAQTAGGSVESDGPKYASPETSNENDAEGAVSPSARHHVQDCLRSSSVTSMHYLSPASGGADNYGGTRREKRPTNSGGVGTVLVLHESPSGNSAAGSLGNLSAGGAERFGDTDRSGSSSGNMASMSRSAVSSNPAMIHSDDPNSAIPCSLSLRLSPSDSGSPTSGALTSESSFDHNKESAIRSQSSPLAAGSSRPFSAPSLPVRTNGARPFRPYASVGPSQVAAADFQLGTGISLASAPQSASYSSRQSTSSLNDAGHGAAAASTTHNLLERVQQLRAVSPGNSGSKVDQILHNFSISACNSDDKFTSAMTEISLEEEEKSLHYIEVSLQEVSRDVQRRKEELRSKRRRLLEDEARMHSIVFQSSSWIESLSGRFSL